MFDVSFYGALMAYQVAIKNIEWRGVMLNSVLNLDHFDID